MSVNAEIQLRPGEKLDDALSRLRHQLSREFIRRPVSFYTKPSKLKYVRRLKRIHLNKIQGRKKRKRYQRVGAPIVESEALQKYSKYLHSKFADGCTFQRSKYDRESNTGVYNRHGSRWSY